MELDYTHKRCSIFLFAYITFEKQFYELVCLRQAALTLKQNYDILTTLYTTYDIIIGVWRFVLCNERDSGDRRCGGLLLVCSLWVMKIVCPS